MSGGWGRGIAEMEDLKAASEISGEPPQIDVETAIEYRRSLPKLLDHGLHAQRKQLVATWVDDMRLTPEQLAVAIA